MASCLRQNTGSMRIFTLYCESHCKGVPIVAHKSTCLVVTSNLLIKLMLHNRHSYNKIDIRNLNEKTYFLNYIVRPQTFNGCQRWYNKQKLSDIIKLTLQFPMYSYNSQFKMMKPYKPKRCTFSQASQFFQAFKPNVYN